MFQPPMDRMLHLQVHYIRTGLHLYGNATIYTIRTYIPTFNSRPESNRINL